MRAAGLLVLGLGLPCWISTFGTAIGARAGEDPAAQALAAAVCDDSVSAVGAEIFSRHPVAAAGTGGGGLLPPAPMSVNCERRGKGAYGFTATRLRGSFLRKLVAAVQSVRQVTAADIVILVNNESHPSPAVLRALDRALHPTADVHVQIIAMPIEETDLPVQARVAARRHSNCCGWHEYAKLAWWAVRGYDRVVALDVDTKLLRSVDHLFDVGQGAGCGLEAPAMDADVLYTPGVGAAWNGGVFVLRPDTQRLAEMRAVLRSSTYASATGWNGAGLGPCGPCGSPACRQQRREGLAHCHATEGPQGFLYHFFVQRRALALPLNPCHYNFQGDRMCAFCLAEWKRTKMAPFVVHKPAVSLAAYFAAVEGAAAMHSWVPGVAPPTSGPMRPARDRAEKGNAADVLVYRPGTPLPWLGPSRGGKEGRWPATTCGVHFFIPGVRKGGTTNLYTWIAQHPDVMGVNLNAGPTAGETRFFVRPGQGNSTSGPNSPYRHAIAARKMTGDSSVDLLLSAYGRNLIRRVCGSDVRFVVLLRDPVARAKSQAKMRWRLGSWKHCHGERSIDDVIGSNVRAFRAGVAKKQARIPGWDPAMPYSNLVTKWAVDPHQRGKRRRLRCPEYVEEALYLKHLRAFVQRFPPARALHHGRNVTLPRVLAVFSEDVYQRPAELLGQVFSFLGLDPTPATDITATRQSNSNSDPSRLGNYTYPSQVVMSPWAEQELCNALAPYNTQLAGYLRVPPSQFPWKLCPPLSVPEEQSG